MDSARAFALEIAATRAIRAQEVALDLRSTGRLRWVADDLDCPDIMRLAALTEELGEIARELHDGNGNVNTEKLRGELDQLAGIALAWSSIL